MSKATASTPMHISTVAIQPRLLRLAEVATYLGLTSRELAKQMPKLKQRHFPDALPILALWDRKMIDAWLDSMSGLRQIKTNFYDPVEYVQHPPVRKYKPAITYAPTPAVVDSNYTVAEAVDDYVKWYRVSRRTIKTTQYVINAFILPEFGSRTVASLTVQEIREWLMHQAERARTVRVPFGQPRRYLPRPTSAEELRQRRNSANRNFAVLKAILNRAFADGKVTSDAAWRPVLPFKRAITSKRLFLSVEECRALVRQLAPDFGRLVQGALHTGARFSEIAQATASDFDEQSGSLHLPPSKTFRARHVMLTQEATEFFAAITKNLSPVDHIFRRADGCPWSLADPYPRLNMACQMAGIKRITFHSLRHTYASLLAMNGAPIHVIAKNLGHTDTVACERYYAHLQPSYVSSTIREKMPLLALDSPSSIEATA